MLTDAVRYKLRLEYENGFGLQYPHPPSTRAPICLLKEKFDVAGNFVPHPDFEEVFQMVKNKTGASTLDWNYCGGRPVASLDWSENSKVEQILDAFVKLELSFQLATKALPQFGYAQKDTEFSFAMVEPRLIQNIEYGLNELPFRICGHLWNDSPLVDIWNWQTEQGKVLCIELRAFLHLPEQSLDDAENFHNWKSYLDFDTWSQNNTPQWV